jgi:excisionase family DNA binding protein
MTERIPNLVPRGSIRISEAFQRLYRKFTPDWSDLEDLCVCWDEAAISGDEPPSEADPYLLIDAGSDRAEQILRNALGDGELRAFVHNYETGIDLELPMAGWRKLGPRSGIRSDSTDERTPGPDCSLNGRQHPIFLDAGAFDRWLAGDQKSDVPAIVAVPLGTASSQALTIDEVVTRSGISRTKIYEALRDGVLSRRKFGKRTLVLQSEFERFLSELPKTTGSHPRSAGSTPQLGVRQGAAGSR